MTTAVAITFDQVRVELVPAHEALDAELRARLVRLLGEKLDAEFMRAIMPSTPAIERPPITAAAAGLERPGCGCAIVHRPSCQFACVT